MISGSLSFYQLNYFDSEGVAHVEWLRASSPLNASISAIKFIYSSDVVSCRLIDVNSSTNTILWSLEV